MLPSGAAEKKAYRRNNSSFETLDSRLAVENNCTESYLLQKPSKSSKSKDHLVSLERR